VQIDLTDRRLLVTQSVLGVLTPVGRCADDNAMREWLTAGGREKAIDIFLLNTVILRIELALDGVVLACAVGLRYEVDSGVAGTDPAS
jgi:hypothetical protein